MRMSPVNSRLIGEDEDATHRTLSDHLDLGAGVIESHRGQVVHNAGDAIDKYISFLTQISRIGR